MILCVYDGVWLWSFCPFHNIYQLGIKPHTGHCVCAIVCVCVCMCE